MSAPVILVPGDGQYALAADGATLKLAGDGSLYRNGFRYVIRGVALAAAKCGVYGQSLFAKGHDGKIWVSTPGGWLEVTDTTTMDPDFLPLMTMDGPNEPT